MTRADARQVFGCVLAVLVPAAVLHFSAGDARHAAGLTAAPFAWPRLLVAHLALALPLGFVGAARLRSVAAVNEAAPPLWPLIGCGLAGLAVMLGGGMEEALAGGEVGAVPLLVLRTALAFALVVPWCLWATDRAEQPPLVRPTTRDPLCSAQWGRTGVALGVALALLPCGLYAEAVIEARTATAAEALASGRTVRAERALAGLCELGSVRPIGGKPPGEVSRRLRAEVAHLARVAAYPLPPSAPPAARFARAEALIQLDRLDDAAELLGPLTERSVVATLLLAAVDRDRERWAASDAGYEAALTRALPSAAKSAAARADCRLAFEGLAYNARMDRRPADAEAALRRGLEVLPADAAHFYFLLGRHFSDGGRAGRAVEHLEEAARLDPAKYREPADTLLRQLRTHTPACAPWRSR